jgi:hypothetical protein
MTSGELLKRLAEELTEIDYCLGEIVLFVRGALRLPAGDIRKPVIGVLRELLTDWGVVAGLPTADDGFLPWDTPLKCTLDRIHCEWSALGRDPFYPEVVWFRKPGPTAG